MDTTNKNAGIVGQTQKHIADVFITILQKTKFQNITVSQIILQSNINRSTFYAHFLDKFDLVDRVKENLLNELRKIANQIPDPKKIDDDFTRAHIKRLTNCLYENGKTFSALLCDTNVGFTNNLNEFFKTVLIEKNFPAPKIPQNYLTAVQASIITGLFAEWAKTCFREPIEKFTEIIVTASKGFALGVLN